MRIVTVSLLALGLLAGALADDFDRKIAAFPLLQNKQVQTELGISAGQLKQMNVFADDFNKKAKAYQAEVLKKAGNDPKKVKPDSARESAMLSDLKTKVINLLNPVQLKRLRELSLQAVGVTALGDDTVAQRVGINATQKTQIRGFVKAGLDAANKILMEVERTSRAGIVQPKSDAEAKKANDVYQGRRQAEMKKVSPQLQKIRQGTIDKVMAVLTPAQKKTWKDLLGKLFG